jgi:hypothetical protein
VAVSPFVDPIALAGMALLEIGCVMEAGDSRLTLIAFPVHWCVIRCQLLPASLLRKRSPAESTARVSIPFEILDAANRLLGKGPLALLAWAAPPPRLKALAETTASSV